MRWRAVILAAGFGTRLRPLTLAVPKALLPVAGTPLVGRTLAQLAAAGCEAVAINLHHLGDRLAARYGSDYEGTPIVYSRETEILGTLGAMAPLREFLEEAELVLVVNGDSLARWPFEALLDHHRKAGAAARASGIEPPSASLLVSSRARPEDFGGGIGVSKSLMPGKTGKAGRLVSFNRAADEARPEPEAENWRVFAGAHVFEPELVAAVQPEPADFVRELYRPALTAGRRLDVVETSAAWFDLGTPRRYLEAVIAWSGRRRLGRRGRRGWRSDSAEVAEDAAVRRSVLESGAQVGGGARLSRALVLPDARIGEGSVIRRSIVGFGASVPAGAVIEERLVTKVRADVVPHPEASVIGDLVLSPLS